MYIFLEEKFCILEHTKNIAKLLSELIFKCRHVNMFRLYYLPSDKFPSLFSFFLHCPLLSKHTSIFFFHVSVT